jgi:predicted nucleic acid-binding protein
VPRNQFVSTVAETVATRDRRLATLTATLIAATAMALEVPVVTQDDDFPDIEGLAVARV